MLFGRELGGTGLLLEERVDEVVGRSRTAAAGRHLILLDHVVLIL